jgi:hypothetical protein
MAKQRCTCGETIFWKADEPHSDEWLVVAKPELPDDLNDLNQGRSPVRRAPPCAQTAGVYGWPGGTKIR